MIFDREKIAKALYDAFREQAEYVGDYKFHNGYTTLDGQWDLLEIVNKIIPEFTVEVTQEYETDCYSSLAPHHGSTSTTWRP